MQAVQANQMNQMNQANQTNQATQARVRKRLWLSPAAVGDFFVEITRVIDNLVKIIQIGDRALATGVAKLRVVLKQRHNRRSSLIKALNCLWQGGVERAIATIHALPDIGYTEAVGWCGIVGIDQSA